MTIGEPTTVALVAEHARRLLAGEADLEMTSDGPPVNWRALTADELVEEWPRLLAWVEHLRIRYPNALRLPECWWRHNDLIEALAALRDFERGCFSRRASPTAAVEWHRAFRDIEARLETWIRRLPCAVAGRAHDPTPVLSQLPEGWVEAVRDDADRRRAREA